MSNLTDLLPAGAGGKQVDFVASGTINNGVTVALNSDGTVTAVSGVTAAIGSNTSFTAASAFPNYISSSYDSNANKVVLVYTNGSGHVIAIVGTVSGTTISFGSAATAASVSSIWLSSSYDTTAQKIVISYTDTTNSYYGKAIVGTVSGTSISFGTPVVYNSGNSYHSNNVYDPSANKTVIAYRDVSSSNQGKAIVGTVSGTSISFGAEATFDTVFCQFPNQVYDANANKISIVYQDANAGDGKAVVGTVSGTSISFGTPITFTTNDLESMSGAYNSNALKVVYCYRDIGNSNFGTVAVGTISGTSISFGTPVTFSSGGVTKPSLAYDSFANKLVISYSDSANSSYGTLVTGTVSGSSITFDSAIIYSSTSFYGTSTFVTYDSSSSKNIISWATNSYQGFSVVYTNAGTNASAFIGISDAAISDTASGSVTIKGGISTNVTGLTPNQNYYVQSDGSLASGNIPYSISGASYDSVNFSVTSQDSSPKGISFNANGTKMFVVGQTNDSVYEYALTTAYDVSTASHSQSFSVASQDANPRGIAFNTAGTKMFVVGYAESRVNEYALATGFDVSTASFSQFFSVASQDSTPQGIAFNTDGTKMFVVGNTGDSVYEYSLTTGFNVSTASFVDSFSVSSEETGPFGVAFNSNGTRMFISGTTPDEVSEYTLTTGFDVSTASYSGISFSVLSQDNQIEDLAFSQDGNKMYVVGNQNDSVYQYSTTAASTTVPAGKALSSTSINLDYTT
jgi:sugar lactone lactonase YvrE